MCRSLLRTNSRYLLRDFIQQSLYHSTQGYFSGDTPPILPCLSSSSSLPHTLPNQQAYQLEVSKIYRQHDHGWMTPVQLFSPHLSHAIANRILSAATASASASPFIHIIEIGPGVATLANDILSFMPSDVLNRIRYSLVEISPALCQIQKYFMSSWVQSNVAVPVLCDARNLSSDVLNIEKDAHVHIIATEVLDNLPHDLIRFQGDTLQQACIHVQPGADVHDRSSRTLKWQAVSSNEEIDEETLNTIRAFNLHNDTVDYPTSSNSSSSLGSYLRSAMDTLMNNGTKQGGGKEVWVPTGCFQLLQSLLNIAPNASFTFTDFTSFPGTLPGLLAPVVQRVSRGSASIYDSVHEAPLGEVDILFPTDFHRVAHAHQSLNHSNNNNTSFDYHVCTQAEFFKQFANENDIKRTTCQNGFNPVLQDFENVSYLTIDPKG